MSRTTRRQAQRRLPAADASLADESLAEPSAADEGARLMAEYCHPAPGPGHRDAACPAPPPNDRRRPAGPSPFLPLLGALGVTLPAARGAAGGGDPGSALAGGAGPTMAGGRDRRGHTALLRFATAAGPAVRMPVGEALGLIELMGQHATLWGVVAVDQIPLALAKLRGAIADERHGAARAAPSNLRARLLPLVGLLDLAWSRGRAVTWSP